MIKMPRAVVEYPWLAPLTFVVLFLALIAFGLWWDRKATEEQTRLRAALTEVQRLLNPKLEIVDWPADSIEVSVPVAGRISTVMPAVLRASNSGLGSPGD